MDQFATKNKYKPFLKPPIAEKAIAFTIVHNDTLYDNYAWMRNREDQKVQEYLDIENEYFNNYISQKYFEKEARIWPNYKTDYKPPLEFAKEKGLKYIATNIPRRYASFVSTKGLDSLQLLSSEAKTFIAPLPIDFDPELPGYKEMATMMRGHGISYLPQAQASKDATMAHFILKNLKEGQTFLHFNGAYHSNNHEGIYWYLKKQNKNLKIITITTVEQDDIKNFDDEIKNMADYFIVVDSDVTKTY